MTTRFANCAVSAFCLLLVSVMRRAAAPSSARPSVKFSFALQQAAEQAIKSAHSADNHVLSATVLGAIMGMRDEKTQRSGNQFFVTYSAIVWNHDIPVALQAFLTDGEPRSVKHRSFIDKPAANGMAPYFTCSRKTPPEFDELIGFLGWPCLDGGSVGIRAVLGGSGSLKNCIVFFAPTATSRQSPTHDIVMYRIDRLSEVRDACVNLHVHVSEMPVDLTALAVCIYDNYPTGPAVPDPPSYMLAALMGIVVIPTWGQDGTDVGRQASSGSLDWQPIEVELPLDLNLSPVYYLQCVAMFDAQENID